MNYGINIEHGPCSFDDLPANNDLVGGFNHVFFHNIWDVILPIDFHFFKVVVAPPTSDDFQVG